MFLRYSLPSCFGVRAVAALAMLMLPTAMAGPAAPRARDRGDRQACRSDFISHCSGVQPEDREALTIPRTQRRSIVDGMQQRSRCVATPKAETETKPEAPPPAAAEKPRATPGRQRRMSLLPSSNLHDQGFHVALLVDPARQPRASAVPAGNAAELSPACQNVVRTCRRHTSGAQHRR
jgi:hypothetical protein